MIGFVPDSTFVSKSPSSRQNFPYKNLGFRKSIFTLKTHRHNLESKRGGNVDALHKDPREQFTTLVAIATEFSDEAVCYFCIYEENSL